mgnify:CR=1 FL=1
MGNVMFENPDTDIERFRQILDVMQPGDVVATFADCSALNAWVGFKPATPIGAGIRAFVDWYRSYYAC